MKLLLTGDGLAIFGGGAEGPLLNGRDDIFIDAVAKATGHFDVGDLACGVDNDVKDDVAFGAVRERGQVRLWCGKVTDQSDVDVA